MVCTYSGIIVIQESREANVYCHENITFILIDFLLVTPCRCMYFYLFFYYFLVFVKDSYEMSLHIAIE